MMLTALMQVRVLTAALGLRKHGRAWDPFHHG